MRTVCSTGPTNLPHVASDATVAHTSGHASASTKLCSNGALQQHTKSSGAGRANWLQSTQPASLLPDASSFG